jgi:hypothetical protein
MLGRNYIGSFVNPNIGLVDAYYNAEFCPIFELNVYDNSFNPVNISNAKSNNLLNGSAIYISSFYIFAQALSLLLNLL